MRVFNKNKTIELTEYDLRKGYLCDDKLFVKHHDAIEAVEEQGHYEVVKEFPNGGKTVEWVVDVPAVEAKEAYDEYEEIQVYIPYTEEELEENKKSYYKFLIEQYIREKYSASDEIAILRKANIEPCEYKEWFDYVESCIEKAKKEIYFLYN